MVPPSAAYAIPFLAQRNQVPAVKPGGGYYLQLEDADEPHPGWLGRRIVGGVGREEFDLIGRGVRTDTFTIGPAQPQVVCKLWMGMDGCAR